MSFLQPEKVPVKVYLSTDKDAPRLDRTPNCVATILKACLVTGYGDKEPAGWSLPFEDNDKGIKVLKPADSPHTPFFMRLSQDTGKEMTVQVYQEMTGVDDGELKLQSANNGRFIYNYANRNSGNWCVIATERGVCFFAETNGVASGTVVFCGDTAKNTRGERAVTILVDNGNGVLSYSHKILTTQNQVGDARVLALFDGRITYSTNVLLSPALLSFGQEIYGLPLYAPSAISLKNYETVHNAGRMFMNHGMAYLYSNNNLCVPTDYWEY